MDEHDWLTISAASLEEAELIGIARLGALREEVEIQVLDEGKKGFLGLGSRPAVIRIRRLVPLMSSAAVSSGQGTLTPKAEKPASPSGTADTAPATARHHEGKPSAPDAAAAPHRAEKPAPQGAEAAPRREQKPATPGADAAPRHAEKPTAQGAEATSRREDKPAAQEGETAPRRGEKAAPPKTEAAQPRREKAASQPAGAAPRRAEKSAGSVAEAASQREEKSAVSGAEREAVAAPGKGEAAKSSRRRRKKSAREAAARHDVAEALLAGAGPEGAPTIAHAPTSELDLIILEEAQKLLAGFKVQMSLSAAEGEPGTRVLSLRGRDARSLVGRDAHVMEAVQHLLRLLVERRVPDAPDVVVDADGYWERHDRKLRELARRVADEVARTGRPVRLRPMPARDRRVIHVTLREDARVSTESHGSGAQRAVVISPQDKA